MKTVHKFALDAVTDLVLPHGTSFLRIGEQEGKVMLWAEVEVQHPHIMFEKVRIHLLPTGQQFNEPLCYIDTTQMLDGIVLHAFWEPRNGTDYKYIPGGPQ